MNFGIELFEISLLPKIMVECVSFFTVGLSWSYYLLKKQQLMCTWYLSKFTSLFDPILEILKRHFCLSFKVPRHFSLWSSIRVLFYTCICANMLLFRCQSAIHFLTGKLHVSSVIHISHACRFQIFVYNGFMSTSVCLCLSTTVAKSISIFCVYILRIRLNFIMHFHLL